jgi:hypothetical protein
MVQFGGGGFFVEVAGRRLFHAESQKLEGSSLAD